MKIISATASNKAKAIDTLVMAFATDPVVRWLYPSPQQYLSAFPTLVELFAGQAFDHGTAYYIAEDAGAALWLPLGIKSDEEAPGALLESTVSEPELGVIMEVFERMGPCQPVEPHWYLPLMGVEPAHQSKGLGSRLLAHVLEGCDRDGIPAYLEATSDGNRTLYERHGFAVIEEIKVGSRPPVGFNLFVLQGLTGRNIPVVARAAIPFFLLLLVAVGLIVAFPEIVTYLPNRMTS